MVTELAGEIHFTCLFYKLDDRCNKEQNYVKWKGVKKYSRLQKSFFAFYNPKAQAYIAVLRVESSLPYKIKPQSELKILESTHKVFVLYIGFHSFFH